MSKQLLFYASVSDLGSMGQWLAEHNVLLLRPCIASLDELILSSLEDFSTTRGWSDIYLTKAEFIDKVQFYHSKNGLLYVEPSDGYTIQFSRPVEIPTSKLIAQCKFYARNGFSEEFDRFTSGLYAAFERRFLLRHKTPLAEWVTAAFTQLEKEGYKPILDIT